MKVLIYSDVHGNLVAFEKMLAVEGKCDQYICLGDLVNYGPWSNECLELAISLPNSQFIMGNHEEAFIAGRYPGKNNLVQTFFQQTCKSFRYLREIKKFLNKTTLDNFICTHTILDRYIYPDTDVKLDNNYLIGHSHYQFHYSNNGFNLYNAGSVGQNRMFINEINYLIYDSESKSIMMKSIIYDIEPVINQMIEEKYPKICIDYYLNKKRKN